MKDTQCHIHFPDSNRTSSEKSNQVSVFLECTRSNSTPQRSRKFARDKLSLRKETWSLESSRDQRFILDTEIEIQASRHRERAHRCFTTQSCFYYFAHVTIQYFSLPMTKFLLKKNNMIRIIQFVAFYMERFKYLSNEPKIFEDLY